MEQNIKIIIIDGIILLITILAIILFVILKPKFGDNTPIDYQINGGKVKVKSELVLPLGSSLPNIQDLVKYNKSSGKIEFYYGFTKQLLVLIMKFMKVPLLLKIKNHLY